MPAAISGAASPVSPAETIQAGNMADCDAYFGMAWWVVGVEDANIMPARGLQSGWEHNPAAA